MTNKRKPLHDDALLGYSCRGPTTKKISHRLERYGKAKFRAVENYNWLDKFRKSLPFFNAERDLVEKLVDNIKKCGSWMLFHHYYTVDKVRLSAMSTCKKHLLCPLCAIRRASKCLSAYLEKFEAITAKNPVLKPYFLTLTVANGENLEERFNHLQHSFKKFMHRKRVAASCGHGRCELNKIHGGVFTYEFTWNAKEGWHPHIHMVCLCDPSDLPDFPQSSTNGLLKKHSKLAQEWLSVTGDSFIVDFRCIESDPVKGFVEVFKYALKFSDLSPEKNYHAYTILKGRRLMGSFGLFRGVKVPEKMTDDLLDDLPYVALMYRYTNGKYALEKRFSTHAVPSQEGKERRDSDILGKSLSLMTQTAPEITQTCTKRCAAQTDDKDKGQCQPNRGIPSPQRGEAMPRKWVDTTGPP